MKRLLLLSCIVWFSCAVKAQAECEYKNLWLAEGLTTDWEESPYFEWLGCGFFISDAGYTGCYDKEQNELYCQCCWKKEGTVFIITSGDDENGFNVLTWNESEINIAPFNEPGTIIRLKRLTP